jgi:CheY-like chemotaxis protein
MLISDVIMAGLNGIDAAICVRAILPQIKILLFSGQAATAGLLEQARVNGYEFEILAKPVHPKELLKKLQSSGIYPAFQQAVKGTAQSAVQQEQIDISPLDLPIDPAGSSPKEN